MVEDRHEADMEQRKYKKPPQRAQKGRNNEIKNYGTYYRKQKATET
jgi:hypothetical protein